MKLFNRCFSGFILSIFISTASLSALADWTILLYVQSRNNLNKFAAKNLSDLALVGSTNNVNVLVQWYQLNQNGIWRYKIAKDQIKLDTFLPTETDGNKVNDLVDSMKWAVTKYPAQKYFLILWNHGFGILDPIWGQLRGMLGLNSVVFSDDPRINTDNITKFFNLDDAEIAQLQRAILFNEVSKTYMNNQVLVEALKKIKTDVLKNKKLNILGMDACLMAMVEVGYQAREYAEYLVASQEVELAHGWDYLSIMQGLGKGNLSPSDLAKSIVMAYENYYKGKVQFYTQSAVKLENMDILKDGLDKIICLSDNLCRQDKVGFKNLIKNARKKSLQFSTRSYIDLHSFLTNFSSELDSYASSNNIDAKSGNGSYKNNAHKSYHKQTVHKEVAKDKQALAKIIKELKDSISDEMTLIKSCVLVNAVGNNMTAAKGLSIYFPINRVDASYTQTDFAKNSLWVNFLKESL